MGRILSSIGIGAATVDTVLPDDTVTAGEDVSAEVQIHGGSAEQTVDEIYFALETRYRRDEGSSVGVVDQFTLTDGFTIGADEERTIPVDIHIPNETPVTYGDVQVWIETGLDIKRAVDPDDTDYISVDPDHYLETLLTAVGELGFDLDQVNVFDDGTAPFETHCGFLQEFEYRPISAAYAEQLDDIELLCHPTPEGVEVAVEVDRAGEPISGWTEVDEHTTTTVVETTDTAAVADELAGLIEKFA
jgi:sporulation-control protein